MFSNFNLGFEIILTIVLLIVVVTFSRHCFSHLENSNLSLLPTDFVCFMFFLLLWSFDPDTSLHHGNKVYPSTSVYFVPKTLKYSFCLPNFSRKPTAGGEVALSSISGRAETLLCVAYIGNTGSKLATVAYISVVHISVVNA